MAFVGFRADASVNIGSGHIMRCLTLAHVLREQGCQVEFFCQDLEGNLGGLIKRQGYEVRLVPAFGANEWLQDSSFMKEYLMSRRSPLEWLVVDHYGLDYRWEEKLRGWTRNIMVIDDLANRNHDCDILLDQNIFSQGEERYAGKISRECISLLGPRYALLRPEFGCKRKNIKVRDGVIRDILVFFGGTDPTNETQKALAALEQMDKSIIVHVVVGENNPLRDLIKRICENQGNTRFYCQIHDMADLMARVDLAMGAGGTATWERCCLGVPSIVVAVADNQVAIARECSRRNWCTYLGRSSEVTADRLRRELERFLNEPRLVSNQSRAALTAVDGNGALYAAEHLLKGIDRR